MQGDNQPACPLLYSLRGFRFCDLLLAAPERAAWQMCMGSEGFQPAVSGIMPELRERAAEGMAPESPREASSRAAQDVRNTLIESCRSVSRRSTLTFKWAQTTREDILSIPLDHLTLGRAALYSAILANSNIRMLMLASSHIDPAVDGIRGAGTQQFLPLALLTRAWQRSLAGALTSAQAGPDSAQSDLDEAWEIAERGPMPLFLADIHLHWARLFGRMTGEPLKYPWESPQHDLAEARRLIVKHGYLRRLPELEDAEAAILG